jgi:flagellar biosynthesis/type III secretory pathway chaperone
MAPSIKILTKVNAMDTAPAPLSPSELLDAARTTCQALLQLLVEENQSLPQHKIAVVEARLASKKRLSLRLEKTLADLKASRAVWQAQPHLARQATLLAEEVRLLADYAASNAQLLRAAHSIRAEIVQVIRDTLDAQAPTMQVYGASGAMRAVSGGTTVLAREV